MNILSKKPSSKTILTRAFSVALAANLIGGYCGGAALAEQMLMNPTIPHKKSATNARTANVQTKKASASLASKKRSSKKAIAQALPGGKATESDNLELRPFSNGSPSEAPKVTNDSFFDAVDTSTKSDISQAASAIAPTTVPTDTTIKTLGATPSAAQAPAAATTDSPSTPTTATTTSAAATSAAAPETSQTAEPKSNTETANTGSNFVLTQSEAATVQILDEQAQSTSLALAPITGLGANAVTPGSHFKQALINGQIILIDNDEAEQVEEDVAFEELPTDEGKTKVKAGARFPVVVTSEITSKTAKKGDPLQARLKYDLKIGNKLVAKKGDMVVGHIKYALKARTILHSLVSPERWYRNSGALGVAFDEIITSSGEHLPLSAQPARMARIVENKAEGRVLGVNHDGVVVGPWSQQLRYKAIRVGLNFALAPAGVFTFGAMPVALGVIGAANPSFAFSKPVGLNVRHRRIKGFFWGALSGVPGSFLIEDTTCKGQEAIIKPGDEFLCEFRQEFTGEPAGEVDMMPGSSAKVRGQVVGQPPKKSKKK
jgi:hypothetical protein